MRDGARPAIAIRASRRGSPRSRRHVGRGRSTARATCRASSRRARALLASRVAPLPLRVVDVGLCEDRAARHGRATPRGRARRSRRPKQVMEHYGALKAACEAVVARVFGDARDASCGPGSSSARSTARDRFGYWVARFVASGAARRSRPARAVVPGAARARRCSSSTRAISRRGCSTSQRATSPGRSTPAVPHGT